MTKYKSKIKGEVDSIKVISYIVMTFFAIICLFLLLYFCCFYQ